MNASTKAEIHLVVAKAGHEQGLLQHLESGFGRVWAQTHPSSDKLRQALEESRPKVLICELDSRGLSVRTISSLIADLKLATHIVAAAPSRSAEAVIRAMSQGACDLVGQSDPLHLQLVVARELGILQSWCERNSQRLAPFLEEEDGQATLDGVRIMTCDLLFANQLGAASAKAVESTSLLQYVDGEHHHIIKQLIKSCLQGEGTITPVPVRINRVNGTQARVLLSVKASYQDDKIGLTLSMRPANEGTDAGAVVAAAKPARPGDSAVTKRIEKALKQNQLSLVVQPISELVGEPERAPSSKLDVIVMLKDAEGVLPSDKLMQEANTSGLVRLVDKWVIHHACVTLHKNPGGKDPVLLFLKLSRQTLGNPLLMATLKQEILEQSVPASSLAFELLESDITSLSHEEQKVLQEMKQAGFLLSISRFGTSQDAQSLLEQVPVDFVKLDPKLTEKVQHSDSTRQFVQQLVQIARTRGIGVISTTVPNASVMATLWSLGMHYVQGNYLQEPPVVLQ